MSITGAVAVASGGAVAVLLNQALQAATTPLERLEAPDANRPGQPLGIGIAVDAAGTPLPELEALAHSPVAAWDTLVLGPSPGDGERRQALDAFFGAPEGGQAVDALGNPTNGDLSLPSVSGGGGPMGAMFHSQPVGSGSGGGGTAVSTPPIDTTPPHLATSTKGDRAPQANSARAAPGATPTSGPQALALALASDPTSTTASPTSAVPSAPTNAPIDFEANQGQAPGQFQFMAHGNSYVLYLSATGATLALPHGSPALTLPGTPTQQSTPSLPSSFDVVQMQITGGNANAQVVGINQLPGVVNDFVGNDPSQWHPNIPTFAQVEVTNVYRGIDLIYYGNAAGQLEYDWVVHTGANPNQIQFSYSGVSGETIDASGNLVLQTPDGSIVQQAPHLYQSTSTGGQQTVSGGYVLLANGQVGFQTGAYDANQTLTIDPAISFSTYLGGSGTDVSDSVAVDATGNIYVGGYTTSPNFPTASPLQSSYAGGTDVFVSKFDPTGKILLYSTYVGGGGTDQANDLAVDANGSVYLTGYTQSSNFPLHNPIQSSLGSGSTKNAFVTKLSPSGNALEYSTYLGGSGSDFAQSIAVDGAGSAFITGNTLSSNFPIANAYQSSNSAAAAGGDAFLSKLSPDGTTLLYSTYLGGATGTDGYGVAVDSSDSAYITGGTNSSNFPTTTLAFQSSLAGGQNVFVTKFAPSGQTLAYSTYLGGLVSDYAWGIAVDANGNAIVAGECQGSNFPTLNAYQSAYGGAGPVGLGDGFVTKLSPTGQTLVYSTYLGTATDDEVLGVALDPSGAVAVVGVTDGTNFPTLNAVQGSYAGGTGSAVGDAFISNFSPTGALLDSTYLGGSAQDYAWGVVVDATGAAYTVGPTQSTDFPTHNAFQSSLRGTQNGFLTKISRTSTLTTLTSNASTVNLGSLLTLTANTTGSGTPSGTVSFYDGPNLLGTATLTSGLATLGLSTLPAGVQQLSARYNGDGTFGLSSAPTTLETVSRGVPVTVALSSPPVLVPGQSGNLTATVTPANGTGTPTGPVTFYDNGVPIGSAPLSGIPGNDQAVLPATLLPSGANTITASYGGDPNYAPTTNSIQSGTYVAPAGDVLLTNVYGTGIGTNGLPLTTHAVDPHFTVTSSTNLALASMAYADIDPGMGTMAFEFINSDGGWIPGNASNSSDWVNPAYATFTSWGGGLTVTYEEKIDLTGYVTNTVMLFGQVAADDSAYVVLNNTTIAYATSSDSWTTFTSNSVGSAYTHATVTFRPGGTNTLDLIFTNQKSMGGSGQHLGVRAELGVAAQPQTAVTTLTAMSRTNDPQQGTTLNVGPAASVDPNSGGLRTRQQLMTGQSQGANNVQQVTVNLGANGNASASDTVMPAAGGVTEQDTANANLNLTASASVNDPSATALAQHAGNPALVYNSNTATTHPYSSIDGQLQLATTTNTYSTIQATLYWNGTAQPTQTFNVPAAAINGGTVDFNLVAPSTSTTTLGAFTVQAVVTSTGGVTTLTTSTGYDAIVVNRNTGFGNGWSFGDPPQLTVVPGVGVVWADDTGDPRYFTGTYPGSGLFTYTNESNKSNDFGTLTETKIGGVATLTYTTVDKYVWTFNSSGQATSLASPQHTTIAYQYNVSGQLTTMTNADGGVTVFTPSGNQISKITEPGGGVVSLGYDAAGDLTSITDATGAKRTLTYDSAGHLTNDQWGPLNATYSYDATTGAVTTIQQDSATSYALNPTILANRTTTAMLASQDVATLKNSLGNVTTYTLDGQGRLLGETRPDGTSMSQVVDKYGNITTSTDFRGATTTYTYSPDGSNLTEVQYPDGEFTSYTYNAQFHEELTETNALGQTITFGYDAVGNRTSMTDAVGDTTQYVYTTTGATVALLQSMTDPRGDTTTYKYNALRQMVSMQDGVGDITSYTYDANGNLKTQTDPNGGVTTTIFDNKGQLLTQTDAVGNRTTYSYDALGDLTQTIDPRGNTIVYAYDARGNQTSMIEAAGSAAARTTTYYYDTNNNPTAVVDPRGLRTTTIYDVNNRPIATEDALGHYTTMTLDGNGNAVVTQDPLGRLTTVGYDVMNRPLVTIDALGNVSDQSFDRAGNLSQAVDPLGQATTYRYDADQRQIAVVDAMGNIATTGYLRGVMNETIDPEGHFTLYGYDADNRNITVADPLYEVTTTVYLHGDVVQNVSARGFITSYALDLAHRVTQTTDPNLKITQTSYDANGNVIAIKDANGFTTTTGYDVFNRPTAVTDPLLHSTTTSYDADGNVLTVKDPLGHITSMTYDNLNREVTVTDANNHTTTTAYDVVGNVTQVTDPLTHSTFYGYDALNRQITVTDALGNVTTSAYNAVNQTAAIDPFGNTTTYVYDSVNRLLAATDALNETTTYLYQQALLAAVVSARGYATTFHYDVAERRVSVTDPNNNTTTTVYDADSDPIAVIDPRGFATTTSYGKAGEVLAVTDPLNHTTTTSYDADYNVMATTDALARTTIYSYDNADRQTGMTDALGHTASWAYDSANRLTAATDVNGHTVTYGYDAANQRTLITDALGNQTSYAYDADGNVTAVTDPLGHATTWTFDADNRTRTVTDPNSNTTTYNYNKTELASVQDARTYITTYGYDALERRNTVTDALLEVTTTTFDADGNVRTVTDPRGFTTTNSYDPGDRLIALTDPLVHTTSYGYDADGNIATVTDALGNVTTTTYDQADRAVTVQTPSTGITTTSYDNVNNVIAVADPLGHTTSYGYDALNRQITVTNALGYTTTTAYDFVGNVTMVQDANGNKTTYAYDADNRQTQMTDAFGHSATWAYDKASRLTSSTDRDGQRINYSYDAGNRKTGETWLSSTGTTVNLLTFTYDQDNDQLTAANNAGAYTYTYDQLDRISTEQEPFAVTLTMGYDKSGNRTFVQDSLGGITTSMYDGAGNLSMREVGGSVATTMRADFSYDARNELTTLTHSSNLSGSAIVGTLAYQYDAQSRLTAETYKTGASTAQAFTYTYDLADRLSSQKINGTLASFSYDNANQLTLDGTTGATYSYDGTGNRTNSGYSTGTGNEIIADGTLTYTYDANGNTISDTIVSSQQVYTETYNNRNQLLTVAVKSSTGLLLQAATYTYDVYGDRLEKDVWSPGNGLVTTKFAYDGPNVLFDLTATNTLQTRYLRGDQPDQLLGREDGTTPYWYVTDRLGSVMAVTNVTGGVVATITYNAFGNGQSVTGSPLGRFGAFGKEVDSETNTIYFGNNQGGGRTYYAGTSRFLTQDPLGFGGGQSNLYSYVMNDPTNLTDPTGMFNTLGWFAKIYVNPDERTWSSFGTALLDDASLGTGIAGAPLGGINPVEAIRQGNPGYNVPLYATYLTVDHLATEVEKDYNGYRANGNSMVFSAVHAVNYNTVGAPAYAYLEIYNEESLRGRDFRRTLQPKDYGDRASSATQGTVNVGAMFVVPLAFEGRAGGAELGTRRSSTPSRPWNSQLTGRSPFNQALQDAKASLKISIDESDKLVVRPSAPTTPEGPVARLPPTSAHPEGQLVPPSGVDTVYTGVGNVPPATVRANGLPARGSDLSLLNHVEGKPNSAFRGSTKIPSDPIREQGAAYWGDVGDTVVELRTVYWETNSLLEGRVQTPGGFRGNLMHGENELTIPAEQSPSNVSRVGTIRENALGRRYIDWLP